MEDKQINNHQNQLTPDPLLKENLLRNLTVLQKKLVKILRAEDKLSRKYPISQNRLDKLKQIREITLNDINNIANLLIDMGETIKVRRFKGR